MPGFDVLEVLEDVLAVVAGVARAPQALLEAGPLLQRCVGEGQGDGVVAPAVVCSALGGGRFPTMGNGEGLPPAPYRVEANGAEHRVKGCIHGRESLGKEGDSHVVNVGEGDAAAAADPTILIRD